LPPPELPPPELPPPPAPPPEITDAQIINLVKIEIEDMMPKVELVTQLKFAFTPEVIIFSNPDVNIVAQVAFEGASIEINRPVFLQQKADFIKFAIAHELAHVIRDHNNMVDDGTEEFRKWSEDSADAIAHVVRSSEIKPLLEFQGRDMLGRLLIPPPDEVNFTGMGFRLELGKIDPPWLIGQAGFATQMFIAQRREFTIQELTVGDFESVGIRINFDSQFSNSSALSVDFELIKPDGSVVVTPEVPTVGAGTWAWAKFAAVFAGPPREISQKGIYRIRAVTNSNDVFNGEANYYFKVT
jgi:hypothetical protein